jgi:hypothetical protein
VHGGKPALGSRQLEPGHHLLPGLESRQLEVERPGGRVTGDLGGAALELAQRPLERVEPRPLDARPGAYGQGPGFGGSLGRVRLLQER